MCLDVPPLSEFEMKVYEVLYMNGSMQSKRSKYMRQSEPRPTCGHEFVAYSDSLTTFHSRYRN
jgi:hypothetical protein